jgi:hypothetical protein
MRTHLMVTRVDPASGTDAEPVIVDTDVEGVVLLELDDGARLEFNRTELTAALIRGPVRIEDRRAA